MSNLEKFLIKYEAIAFSVILAIAGVMAYHNQFIQDDAYISFVYARNFAEGHGLRWYPGSDEYGYTNFLFTLLVGILIWFGADAEVAVFLITVPSFIFSLLLAYLIGRKITSSPIPAFLTVMALATHHTFTAYATGGLETAFVLLLILLAYNALVDWDKNKHKKFLLYIATFSSLALLTRLDSALLLFPVYGFLAAHYFLDIRQRKVTVRQASFELGWVVAIPTIAVCALLAFTYSYYGYALPTTFYAKIDDAWYVKEGLSYLSLYFEAQYYVPLLIFVAIILLITEWLRKVYYWLLFIPLMIWVLYILKIGGDFMEFRILMPILPFFYLLMAYITSMQRRYGKCLFLLAAILVCFGNWKHREYDFYEGDELNANFVEPTRMLDYWVSGDSTNWTNAGEGLRELFLQADSLLIGTTAAGAITYYSRLHFIDELGLNTRSVLEKGNSDFLISASGHRSIATDNFLIKAKVHFIIDHPIFLQKKNGYFTCVPKPSTIKSREWNKFMPLLLPVRDNYYLLAFYVTRHPAIEKAISKGIIYKLKQQKIQCGGSRKQLILPVDINLRR